MVKRKLSRGYTFIEMLFVLIVLTSLLLISLPVVKTNKQKSINQIILEANLAQIDAIYYCDYQSYSYDQLEIDFNRLGNVKMANSYYLDNGIIIVSLATGRIYEKK